MLPLNGTSSCFREFRIKEAIREPHHDYGAFWAQAEATQNPLPRRAWAYQERMLSRRIVHFLPGEVVWECNTCFDCQCQGVHCLINFKADFMHKLRSKDTSPDGITRRTTAWIFILEVFTALGITKRSDHLPALSGMARLCQLEGNWGKYTAGFWHSDIQYLTSFECVRPGETKRFTSHYLAPSWSWVGLEGPV